MIFTDYAARNDEKRNSVFHRLQRAEKEISGNFPKMSNLALSRDYILGGEKISLPREGKRCTFKVQGKNMPDLL